MSKAAELAAQITQIRSEAKQAVKDLFREVMDADENITWISWTGTPNSYCDEGYACEGMIRISTTTFENDDVDEYYGDDEREGIWSYDNEHNTMRYNYQTRKYEDVPVTDLPKYTQVAKQLFSEVKELGALLDGASISLTRYSIE